LVTDGDLPDACRRAGHDDVARGEADLLRELVDDLRHVPDHLREVAVLFDDAVLLEVNAALRGMADLARRPEGAHRRGRVERFSDLPRPLDVARSDLQIAPRQVDADAVAPDAIERLCGRDVAAAAC